MTKLARAIRDLAGVDSLQKTGYVVGTVVSVNTEDRTCDVSTISDRGEQILAGVNLMAEVDDGLLKIPAIDSTVVLGFSDTLNYFVCMWSELQKVVLIVGDSGIEVTSDLIKFNDGSFGGLIKINDLVGRLNQVEEALSDLITKYNTHVHTGVTTGGGSSAITPTQSSKIVTNTTVDQIENPLLTHGAAI
jgi:hypothetical protein